MMFETITLITDKRGVATLTLNRPEKHNAMSGQMIDELTQAAARLDADAAVRVVVITGQGRSFCAGGDLAWMRAQMAADSATRAAEARKLADMLGAVLDVAPAQDLAGHYHDTGGRALANIDASIALGLRVFDTSVGGLGGCPYAPGASGNVATETTARHLAAQGFDTGLDLAVIDAAAKLARTMRGTNDV